MTSVENEVMFDDLAAWSWVLVNSALL